MMNSKNLNKDVEAEKLREALTFIKSLVEDGIICDKRANIEATSVYDSLCHDNGLIWRACAEAFGEEVPEPWPINDQGEEVSD